MNGGDRLAVIARVRPLSKTELARKEHSVVAICRNSISLRQYGIESAQNGKVFRLDSVLDENSSQYDVFNQIEPMLQTSLEGYNTTIFTYGQSGSGKTYSMLGDDLWAMAKESLLKYPKLNYSREYQNALQSVAADIFINPDNIGIIPRTTDWLFDMTNVRKEQGTSVKILISYLEIQNERLVDLLNSSDPITPAHISPSRGLTSIVGPTFSTSISPKQLLNIREIDGDVTVTGLTLIEVESAEEVREVLWIGAKARSVAATDLNEYSSRSHTIFQIHVELSDNRTMLRTKSKISLVDLAGSERLQAFQMANISQERIREFTCINRSLSSLSNCISALLQKSRVHIPYRDSKLTRLLQNSLGGNTRSAFIVTISPSISCYEETLSSLKFANKAIKVALQTAPNKTVFGNNENFHGNSLTELENCKGEILELKKMVEILLLQRNDTVIVKQPLSVSHHSNDHHNDHNNRDNDYYHNNDHNNGQDEGICQGKSGSKRISPRHNEHYDEKCEQQLFDSSDSHVESKSPRSAHDKKKENEKEKENKINTEIPGNNDIVKKDNHYHNNINDNDNNNHYKNNNNNNDNNNNDNHNNRIIKNSNIPIAVKSSKTDGYLKRDLSRYVIQPPSNKNRSSSPSPTKPQPSQKIIQNADNNRKGTSKNSPNIDNTNSSPTRKRIEIEKIDNKKQIENNIQKTQITNSSKQNLIKGKTKFKSKMLNQSNFVQDSINPYESPKGTLEGNNETSRWLGKCSRSKSLSEQGHHGRDGTGGIPTSSSTIRSSCNSSNNSHFLNHSNSDKSRRYEDKVKGTLRPTARSSSFCSNDVDDNDDDDGDHDRVHDQSVPEYRSNLRSNSISKSISNSNTNTNANSNENTNLKSNKSYNKDGKEIKENYTQRYVEVLEENKESSNTNILERVRLMEASVRSQAEELVKAKRLFEKV